MQCVYVICNYMFNCRGAMTASPYISSLMDTHDLICLQEHHLYSEHTSFLTTLHSEYTGEVKVCDENIPFSTIRLRKGGLSVLWRKSLDCYISNVSMPIETDRLLLVRVDLPNGLPIFIVNSYLPTTNVSLDSYRIYR
jgi:hypothetical protein